MQEKNECDLKRHCAPAGPVEPASRGFLGEEPSAKAKSQPLRRGVEPCPERGLFCHALGPNSGVGGQTERGREEGKGNNKEGRLSGPLSLLCTETGCVGAVSEGACPDRST